MNANTPDIALLQVWQHRRDPDAFQLIVARHASLVFNTCRHIIKNDADAADISQECFLSLATTPPQIERSLAGWLHRLATHRSLNHLKQEQRRRQREIRYAEGLPEWSAGERDDLLDAVDLAIDALPDEVRIPVIEHYLRQQSHQQIADALRIPRRTVTNRITRGVSLLREELRNRGIITPAVGLAAFLETALAPAAVPDVMCASLGKFAMAGAGYGTTLGAWSGAAAVLMSKGGIATLAAGVVLISAAWVLLRGTEPPPGGSGPPPTPVEMEAALNAASESAVQAPETAVAAIPTGVADVTVMAEGPGTIFGRVLSREGEPVAATVRAIPAQYMESKPEPVLLDLAPRNLEVDTSGRFTFKLLPLDTYIILAVAGDLGAYGEARLSDAYPVNEMELILEPGGAISGRVTDTDGAPIPGARVYPVARDRYRVGESEMRGLSVVTGSGGAFLLPFLPAEQWQLLAAARGCQPSLTEDLTVGAKSVEIVLKPGLTLAGRVVDAVSDVGIEGMTLSATEEGIPVRARARTEAGGTFVFDGIAPGDVSVTGDHATHVLKEHPVSLSVPEEEGEPVRLEATPGGKVRGRIVLANGEGIEGVRIGLRSTGHSQSAITGSGGRYDFDNVPGGNYGLGTLAVTPFDRREIHVSPGETTEVLDWGITSGIVRGVVVNQSGRPVSRATVWLSNAAPVTGVWTDSKGEFQAVEPGVRGILTVTASKFDRSSRLVKIDLDQDPAPYVKLTLDQSRGLVAGQVVDERGAPVRTRLAISTYTGTYIPDHLVNQTPGFISPYGEPPPPPAEGQTNWDITIPTDSEGYFLAWVDTPADLKFFVSAYTPESVLSKKNLVQELALRAGEVRKGIRLVYKAEPGVSIRGRVQDAAGHPLPHVSVTARIEKSMGESGVANSDLEGNFAINGLQGDMFTVVAHTGDHLASTIPDVPAGTTDLVIVLNKLARVTGIVQDARTGAPLTTFEAAFVFAGGGTAYAQFQQISSVQGEFDLTAPDPRPELESDLVIQAAGYDPARLTLGSISGDVGPLTVTMSPAGPPVSGIVVDEEGNPISGAAIAFRSLSGALSSGSMLTATSASDGTFQHAGVPGDTESLEASHPDFVRARQTIDPHSGDAVTVIMSKGGALEGIVTEDGRPVEKLSLRVAEAETPIQRTDAEGRFRFRHLPVGTVTLRLRTYGPDGEVTLHMVETEVVAGEVRTVRLAFQNGGIVVEE